MERHVSSHPRIHCLPCCDSSSLIAAILILQGKKQPLPELWSMASSSNQDVPLRPHRFEEDMDLHRFKGLQFVWKRAASLKHWQLGSPNTAKRRMYLGSNEKITNQTLCLSSVSITCHMVLVWIEHHLLETLGLRKQARIWELVYFLTSISSHSLDAEIYAIFWKTTKGHQLCPALWRNLGVPKTEPGKKKVMKTENGSPGPSDHHLVTKFHDLKVADLPGKGWLEGNFTKLMISWNSSMISDSWRSFCFSHFTFLWWCYW